MLISILIEQRRLDEACAMVLDVLDEDLPARLAAALTAAQEHRPLYLNGGRPRRNR
ncbi:hypothetical protein LO762_09070 [Actinocorallia sp. API 0066]|uniref:hypothetical protein n=1 Tax=Actinocorallia sp. API 0066 TaxID=2896846 RepID=UPI001E3B5ECF|nr:hypothetical protein [Actinocorallia sp. API 0066]MCD0449338.1 hypothetical protein [Actinocorallia sp. API 0066]